MLGIVLAILIVAFGIFLKTTKDPKLTSSKKYSWLFFIVGIISLVGKLVIMYQKGEL